MLRKLLLVIAAAAATFSLSAFALGLGEVDIRSSLGEPLRASIELRSVEAEEGQEMDVSLATPDQFKQAGVPWAPVLNELKLSIERNAAGKREIQVRTRGPIKEPFLDFLIELNWPSGRLVREYTLLLDPPMLVPAAAPAPQAPVASSQATRSSAPAAAPVAAPVTGWTVKRGDTLWKIAERVRPDASLSVHQVMTGLQRANPDAFIGGNINRLKAGVVLRVPDAAELSALNASTARQETARQLSEWRDSSPQAAPAAPKPAAAAPAPVQPVVKLVVPTEPVAATGGASGAATATDGDSEVARQLVLANEENAALQLKIDDLEDQLERLSAEMSRLLTLQENDLAALQESLREERPEAAVEETAHAMEAAGEAAHGDMAATMTEHADEGPAEAGHDERAAGETHAAADSHAETAMADEHAEGAAHDDGHAAGAAHDDGHTAGAAHDDGHAAAPADSGPFGVVRGLLAPYLPAALLGDTAQMGIAGVLVLLLLLWLFSRRRGSGAEAAAPSEAVPVAQPEAAAPVATKAAAAAAPVDDEDVFGDFMTDEPEGDEVSSDPLGEADVYLAYGRVAEAEELLRKALVHDPDSADIQLKLLEVYQSNGESGAFAAQFDAFAERHAASGGPQWEHALQLARQIVPGHPLVTDGSAGAPMDENPDQFADFGEIGSEADEIEGGSLDFEPVFGDDDLENADDEPFDLGDETEEEAPVARPAEPVAAEPEPEEGLLEMTSEFDVGDISDISDIGEPGELGEAEEPAKEDDETELLDLGGDLSAGGDLDAGNDLDFDLEFDLSEEPAAEAAEPEQGGAEPAEDGGLSFDSEAFATAGEPADEMALDEPDADEAPPAEAGDLDSEMVANKLELARAYIDMEDWEGARDILGEVAQEGNAAQKAEAQELLARCS